MSGEAPKPLRQRSNVIRGEGSSLCQAGYSSSEHAEPSCSLQVPGDGGGEAGGPERSWEDPAYGTRQPAEPAAEAGGGRDPAVGTPAAEPRLPKAGGGEGTGRGSRSGDGAAPLGLQCLAPGSAGSPSRNRGGPRVTVVSAQAGASTSLTSR